MTIIQIIKIRMNPRMNVQDPAHFDKPSAVFCPRVSFLLSWNGILIPLVRLEVSFSTFFSVFFRSVVIDLFWMISFFWFAFLRGILSLLFCL